MECEVVAEIVLASVCLLVGFVCVWPVTEKATQIPKSKDVCILFFTRLCKVIKKLDKFREHFILSGFKGFYQF